MNGAVLAAFVMLGVGELVLALAIIAHVDRRHHR
jgi:hypothetical protein